MALGKTKAANAAVNAAIDSGNDAQVPLSAGG